MHMSVGSESLFNFNAVEVKVDAVKTGNQVDIRATVTAIDGDGVVHPWVFTTTTPHKGGWVETDFAGAALFELDALLQAVAKESGRAVRREMNRK